ncbi:CagC family type IV secretion system protein [Solibacillus sp. MA9]|uniref:CagC family type IV secretion system protein n=1 Tax=Solibacillus palustris TaxID=2908203 RepID=A0ABS9UBS6_9BACL|nr:CagC family type IV secretion system protein [Solibacillus sp. MA9]MCH7321430.1 CagC family type IV secretion system protein [Solibacillus sp. MA9]
MFYIKEANPSLAHKCSECLEGILTAFVALVGFCTTLFIIIKRMPSANDPHEKNERARLVCTLAVLV